MVLDKKTIADELTQIEVKIEQLQTQLLKLPKGTIRKKTRNEKTYHYLHYRMNNKVIDRYVPKSELSGLEEQVLERKRLADSIAELKKDAASLHRRLNEKLRKTT